MAPTTKHTQARVCAVVGLSGPGFFYGYWQSRLREFRWRWPVRETEESMIKRATEAERLTPDGCDWSNLSWNLCPNHFSPRNNDGWRLGEKGFLSTEKNPTIIPSSSEEFLRLLAIMPRPKLLTCSPRVKTTQFTKKIPKVTKDIWILDIVIKKETSGRRPVSWAIIKKEQC